MSMKPGDNIYFFCKRRYYGIGELISIGPDCKYCNCLLYTSLFSFLSGWSYSPKTLKNKLLTQKNRLKGGSSEKGGPSDRIRTCGILLPNLSGILFPLVYSGFQQFPICFTYSLTLLSPLFPGVPALSVVIYVVKNASRPVSGECSPMPSGKRFSLLLAAL